MDWTSGLILASELVIGVVGYLLNRNISAIDQELKEIRVRGHDTREKLNTLTYRVVAIETRQDERDRER